MSKFIFQIDKSSFSEWYSKIISTAEIADVRYGVAGFIVIRPWGMYIARELYRLFEAELEKRGHQPSLFPTVIPEENLEVEKEHVTGFKPEVFWVTEAGEEKLERRLALRPTSETAMYPMYKLWIQGRRDLPLKLYQSCSVFRYEKTPRPFIKGREFLWIEAHDAFATLEEAERQVLEDMETTRSVLYEKLGVPIMPFQRPEWDKFPGAVHTYAHDVLMPDGRVCQVASTHLLGQNFSKAFDIIFLDEDGQRKHVYQTCYGIGISRMIAALISVHGDSGGLVLPFPVAPIQVVIVPIPGEETARVLEKCRQLEQQLREVGFRVHLDDAPERTPGYKYYYWEMKGVPVRIEVGKQEVESETLTLARRDTREKIRVREEELVDAIREIAEDMLRNLKARGEANLNSMIRDASSFSELRQYLEEGGYVRAGFCSTSWEGEPCAAKIQEETRGRVRGFRIDVEEEPEGTCIVCGKPAKHVVYIARQY